MKLFGYECYKLFSQKAILFLLVFLFLFNGFSYWNTQRQTYAQEMMVQSSYQALLQHCQKQEVSQAIEELESYSEELQIRTRYRHSQLSGNVMEAESLKNEYPELFSENWAPKYSDEETIDNQIVGTILDQLTYIRDYESQITKIQKQSETMLSTDIFQNSSGYSHNNILKTAEDFSSLYQLPLSLDMDYGVEQVSRGGFSDVLLLAMILLLALGLIAKEKQSGVLQLVQPTLKGREKTLLAKLLVLIAGCALSTILVFSTNLLISGTQFGFGNLNRYVQSISSFFSMEIVLTVGEFFLLTLLLKLFFAVVIGLLCFAVLCFCKSTIFSYGFLALWLGGSYLLYTYIPANAFLNHLKYLNIFQFLDSASLLKDYQNLNIFSQAVNLRVLSLISGLVLLIAALMLSIASYRSRRFFTAASKAPAWVEKISVRFASPKKGYPMSLFLQECYKLFVKYKAALPLVLVIIVMLSSYGTYNPIIVDQEEAFYYQTISLHSGPISQEPARFISSSKEELEKSQEEIKQAEEDLLAGSLSEQDYNKLIRQSQSLEAAKPSFTMYEQRYQQLLTSMETTGVEPDLIDNRPYQILFTTKTDYLTDRYFSYSNSLILLLAALILGCGGMFCYENKKHSKHLLLSMYHGRSPLLRNKILACTCYSILSGIVVQTIFVLNIFHSFYLDMQNVPLQSVTGFECFPWRWTVYQAMGMQFLYQVLTILVIMMIILVLSEFSGSYLNTVFFASVVLILPIILYSFGLEPAKYASCYLPFVFYPMLQSDARWILLPAVAIGELLLFLLCLFLLQRRYRISGKRGRHLETRYT